MIGLNEYRKENDVKTLKKDPMVKVTHATMSREAIVEFLAEKAAIERVLALNVFDETTTKAEVTLRERISWANAQLSNTATTSATFVFTHARIIAGERDGYDQSPDEIQSDEGNHTLADLDRRLSDKVGGDCFYDYEITITRRPSR